MDRINKVMKLFESASSETQEYIIWLLEQDSASPLFHGLEGDSHGRNGDGT